MLNDERSGVMRYVRQPDRRSSLEMVVSSSRSDLHLPLLQEHDVFRTAVLLVLVVSVVGAVNDQGRRWCDGRPLLNRTSSCFLVRSLDERSKNAHSEVQRRLGSGVDVDRSDEGLEEVGLNS